MILNIQTIKKQKTNLNESIAKCMQSTCTPIWQTFSDEGNKQKLLRTSVSFTVQMHIIFKHCFVYTSLTHANYSKIHLWRASSYIITAQ